MQCPKCGRENPGEPHTCNLCGHDLTGLSEPFVPKTSKTAIASLVLGLLSIFTLFITALPAIVLGCIALRQIRKRRSHLKGERLAIIGCCIPIIGVPVFLAVAYPIWKLDAPPIANNYTISDLRSAPDQYSDSYEVFNSLGDPDANISDAPAIGLPEQDIETLDEIYAVFKKDDYTQICEALEANAVSIQTLWENSQKGQAIISQLDTFPEIADMAEPFMDAEIVFLKNLRHMAHLYSLYVCLQAQQGNEQIAITELLRLDSVCRKYDLNARSLASKLVCMAIFTEDLQRANFIANNPRCSDELVAVVAEHFGPFPEERLSMRNPTIFEHLILGNELTKVLGKAPLKFNSTLRLHRNFTDDWLALDEDAAWHTRERFSIWPSIYPELPVSIDPNGWLPWHYKVYNPVGSMFIEILLPAMERIRQIRTKVQINNDLLQIVLNKRLGKPINLKARAYGDEYIVDLESKKIFSPGRDGQIDTKDDIKLPINPEVLGWTE